MALTDLTCEVVQAAVDEYDSLGVEGLLKGHGLSGGEGQTVRLNERTYDARVLAAVAHGFVPGLSDLDPQAMTESNSAITRIFCGLGLAATLERKRPRDAANDATKGLANWSRRLLTTIWNEVKYSERPSWPPSWLKSLVVIIVAIVAALVVKYVLYIAIAITASIGLDIGKWAVVSSLAHMITIPVDNYIQAHGERFPLTPQQLGSTWLILGAVAYIMAVRGSIVGRLSWTFFGVLTVAAVWAGSPASGRLVAVGVAGMMWMLSSTFAFGRSRRDRDNDSFQGESKGNLLKRFIEGRRFTAEERAQDNLVKRGHTATLEEYFDDHGNESIDKIRKQLGVSIKETKKLLSAKCSDRVPNRKMSPKIARQVENDLAAGLKKAEIANRHQVTVSQVTGVAKRRAAMTASVTDNVKIAQPGE